MADPLLYPSLLQKPGPVVTWFDLQAVGGGTNGPGKQQPVAPVTPHFLEPYRYPLLPSAIGEHHTRRGPNPKPPPYVAPLTTMSPWNFTSGLKAHQGKTLNEDRSAFGMRLDGTDHTRGKIMPRADGYFPQLNNRLGRA